MAEHWLDKMPQIPLSRGVPVIDMDDEARCSEVWLSLRGEDHVCTNSQGHRVYCQTVRVDLEDHKGFAYAVRWLYRRGPCPHLDVYLEQVAGRRGYDTGDALLLALLLGLALIRDADRLAIAIACAEALGE